MEKPMITHAQRRIIDVMKTGVRIGVTINGAEREYWFTNGERLKDIRPVKSLINMAIIAPSNDGIFGDTQTYELVFIPGEGVVQKEKGQPEGQPNSEAV